MQKAYAYAIHYIELFQFQQAYIQNSPFFGEMNRSIYLNVSQYKAGKLKGEFVVLPSLFWLLLQLPMKRLMHSFVADDCIMCSCLFC